MSSAAVSPPVVKARALHCTNCGGPIELRGFAHTLSVVCPQCHTVLDVSSPLVQILQRAEEAEAQFQPTVPLGARGKLDNILWEVIGFQIRSIVVDDVTYSWAEYVLFNPYCGFRYLSEYQGHWNYIRTLTLLPEGGPSLGRPVFRLQGVTYRHFQHSNAVTAFVLGEFPWRAQKGETVAVDDFISPPWMLSREGTGNETVWSLGEYYTGVQIWKAFNLPGRPNPAVGVYANQPSPHRGRVGAMWRTFLWLTVALAGLLFFFIVTSRQERVLEDRYTFSAGAGAEPSFVTPVFELKGRSSNVQLDISTDLDNSWAYFNLALINQDNGHAYDFGREVSYYHGVDGGENWSEGKASDSVRVPSVPPGHYYLRIEPELDPKHTSAMSYELTVRRDMPSYLFFVIAVILLAVPPLVSTMRIGSFETARWRESDYAPRGGGGD